MLLALSGTIFLRVQTAPDVAAASQPPDFLSNYVTSLNYSNWDSYGCEQVEYSTSVGVSEISLILDFGQPWDEDGEYGTILLHSDLFAQWDSGGTSGIRYLIANFLTGYWNCHTSKSPFILLVVGDSNYGLSNVTDTNAMWMGEVVSAINSWIESNGWSDFEAAEAGSDTETEYSSYALTLSYLTTVADDEGPAFIYDFGDAGGCPTGGEGFNDGCNNGWTQGEVWEVSWGEPWANTLPEIYNQSGAQAAQWYWISKLAIAEGDGPIYFDGELTQYTACEQEGASEYCSGTDNTPAEGWAQLYDKAYADTATRPGVVDDMIFSDDIRYLG